MITDLFNSFAAHPVIGMVLTAAAVVIGSQFRLIHVEVNKLGK